MVETERPEAQIRFQEQEECRIAVGLSLMQHKGFVEGQTVSGGSSEHRDIPQPRVQCGNEKIFLLGQAIGKNECNAFPVGRVRKPGCQHAGLSGGPFDGGPPQRLDQGRRAPEMPPREGDHHQGVVFVTQGRDLPCRGTAEYRGRGKNGRDFLRNRGRLEMVGNEHENKTRRMGRKAHRRFANGGFRGPGMRNPDLDREWLAGLVDGLDVHCHLAQQGSGIAI